MGKSIETRYYSVVLLAVITGMFIGCTGNEPALTDQSAVSQPDDSDTDTASNNMEAGLWAPMAKVSRIIELAEECCKTTGHANECWEEDAIADNINGFILCNSDADCGERACYKSSAITATLAKYPRITATGMCECDSHEDCRDTAGDGGTCFTYSDVGTGDNVNLCGPSMCNGYYVCSCWGGCTWWDGNNISNTPSDDATGLGLYCCENSEYANPELESGLVAFGDESCAVSSPPTCTTDTDCDLPSVKNPDWNDQCVNMSCNNGTGQCEYTLKGADVECDLDSDICTLDMCDVNGICEYKSPRVAPDTYGATSELNTCTIDCTAALDNLSWEPYTPETLPTDVLTRVTTSPCHQWTCTTSGGVTYPDEVPVVCDDTNTSDCTVPVCDPNGDQGNCAATEDIVCSGPASVCNIPACQSGGCAEVFDPSQENETDGCTAEKNVFFASSQPNCFSKCQQTGTSGECSDLYAINDSCATAIDLGDFTATNGVTVLTAKGTTACATNQHWSSNTTCLENDYRPMGHDSPDVVYKFQYQPLDDGVQDQYVIKMETINGTNYDEVLYASVGDDSCVSGAIASDDCDIYNPPDVLFPKKSHEDRCLANKPHALAWDRCEPVDTSGNYTSGMGRTIVAEDTSDFSGGLITVYVYVDGNSEYANVDNSGDFFLSITREIHSECPPLSTWYNGTVRTPAVAPDGVPINGSNFPGFTPNTLTGADGRIANGVLLSGETNNDANRYTGETGDDPFAWNAFDEAWQLDVTAATRVSASLCDFQSSVAAWNYDPMVGLFNCHGERVIFNDNGADLPYYTEGDALCGTTKSHIPQTPTLAPDKAPYYLIVDGYYQPWVRGTEAGSAYQLAVYYDPFSPIECDPSDDNGFGLIRSGSVGPYPDRANIDITQSQCALLVSSDGESPLPGRTVSFHWDGGIQPSGWECETGTWSYCLPLTLTMTMIYENASGDACTQTIINWSNGDHGDYPPVYVPTSITDPDGVTCDQFVGIATSFEYPPNLTPAQQAECAIHCYLVNLKFDA